MKFVFMLILSATGLALVGCGPATDDPDLGGLSAEDAQKLDEAAERLDTEVITPPPPAETVQ